MTKTNVQSTPSNSQHHDTPLLFAPSGANHEQGLGWDRVCEAQRSNESPSGAFKRQRGLR